LSLRSKEGFIGNIARFVSYEVVLPMAAFTAVAGALGWSMDFPNSDIASTTPGVKCINGSLRGAAVKNFNMNQDPGPLNICLYIPREESHRSGVDYARKLRDKYPELYLEVIDDINLKLEPIGTIQKDSAWYAVKYSSALATRGSE
jgi:hypothetical protein